MVIVKRIQTFVEQSDDERLRRESEKINWRVNVQYV